MPRPSCNAAPGDQEATAPRSVPPAPAGRRKTTAPTGHRHRSSPDLGAPALAAAFAQAGLASPPDVAQPVPRPERTRCPAPHSDTTGRVQAAPADPSLLHSAIPANSPMSLVD